MMSLRDNYTRAPPGNEHIPRLSSDNWGDVRSALAEHGCCIMEQAATSDEMAEAESLFFRFLSSTGEGIMVN